MKITEKIPYEYKNAPIPGGGYVTGLIYHRKKAGILYARTDIGGTYRFDATKGQWESLIEHVTCQKLSEAYPIALALDDNYPERLYIVSGIRDEECGMLSISEDYGRNFVYKKIPTMVHGNLSGRGTGYRLVVDKNDSNTLYFASQLGGLLKSTDRGDTWIRLDIEEDYMTFVWVSDDSNTIVAGTAGYTTRTDDTLRGHSLYVSYDGGIKFEKLMQPENVIVNDSKMNGLVASRYDYDGKYLYVTMNSTGRWNYIVDLGYSCDTGDVIGGKVIRYYFKDGKIAGFDDITPNDEGGHTYGYLNYGFGGVCSCQTKPGLLVCTTLCREKEDAEHIYISEDYGNSWKISLNGLEEGDIYFRTSYMQPKYNGNVSILHWASDIKINPFNANEAWFNSGTGVFKTDALLSEHPKYHDWCDGIEETVHLNVYGPVDGDVLMVDIVGDLGGFAFRDLTKPCENSFDDKDGNRYITCINADISDTNCNLAVIMARGNWKGKTKGGLICTKDGFKTFERIPMPFGIGGEIAEKLHRIEKPNTNPGWVAMSSDGQNIVWAIADDIKLPVNLVIVTNDGGDSFVQANITDLCGNVVTEGYFKAFSDRCDNEVFYGFGDNGRLYVSTDGGRNFCEKNPVCIDKTGRELKMPKMNFGYIDTVNKAEIRGVAGEYGTFYITMENDGLWKFIYDKENDLIKLIRLTDDGEICYRMGLGVGRPDGNYIGGNKAIYINGVIDGKYGFYRTLDECETFAGINTDNQMYGEINSIDGDKKVFGRVFIATGSRGVLYGEEH
ncbi:MAG: endoglucanase [Lachnospiraceae bacterium]|nr:endoglucanase [Lachnospiraceae bacterium]